MSFFFTEKKRGKPRTAISEKTLHSLECAACPLNKADVKNGKMLPDGSTSPLAYFIGEAPGEVEDNEGIPFIGKTGTLLRKTVTKIAKDLDLHTKDSFRFNNVIRTRPKDNRDPDWNEIECCRPSIERDILKTNPKIIIGLGNIPLKWATKEPSLRISEWRGRIFPIKIQNKCFWFFSTFHPSYIKRKVDQQHDGDYEKIPGDAFKDVWKKDLGRAIWAANKGLPEAKVEPKEDYYKNITLIKGYKGHKDIDRIERFLKSSAKKKLAAIDYETNGLRPYVLNSKILTASVCDGKRTIAFPFYHSEAHWNRSHIKRLTKIWKTFLQTRKCSKIAHHVAFEQEWTAYFYGDAIIRESTWHDTMAQAFVLDERKGVFSLGFLCLQYFGVNIKNLENVDVNNLDNEPLEDVLRYNALDSKYDYRLFIEQRQLIKSDNLIPIYKEYVARIPTLVLAQKTGIPIDQEEIKRLQKSLKKSIDKTSKKMLNRKCCKLFKKQYRKIFNFASSKDTVRMFRDILKCKEGKKRGGGYNTDDKAMKLIKHPIAKDVSELRSLTKMKSTYVDNFELGKGKFIYPDGLTHCVYKTVFVITGRLSSEEPNNQNWPKRKNQHVKKSMAAGEYYIFVALDHGQIEARVIAMAAKDKNLVAAFWEQYDIHGEWAERIVSAYPAVIGGKKFLKDKEVFKEIRYRSKNQFVFPSFYGALAPSISNSLGIPKHIVDKLQEEFWNMFPGVKEWQAYMYDTYDTKGYVESLTGRRRRAPISQNMKINSPIQGAAADIVIDGMNRLSVDAIKLDRPQLQSPLNVHDDLTFRLPLDTLEEDLETIITYMLNVPYSFINVPLSVEVQAGHNMYELEEIGTYYSNLWEGKL